MQPQSPTRKIESPVCGMKKSAFRQIPRPVLDSLNQLVILAQTKSKIRPTVAYDQVK